MNEIVSLSKLSQNSQGIITDILPYTKNEKASKHLKDIGFIPGRKVKWERKLQDTYIARVDDDNAFAMNKSLVNIIMVNPLEKDVFEEAKPHKTPNLLSRIKNYIINQIHGGVRGK